MIIVIKEPLSTDSWVAAICFFPLRATIFGILLWTIERPLSSIARSNEILG
jgi:hypothetical protein